MSWNCDSFACQETVRIWRASGDASVALILSVIMATSTHIIGFLFTFQMIHWVSSPVIVVLRKLTSLSTA
jgi:hypothetical protein